MSELDDIKSYAFGDDYVAKPSVSPEEAIANF